MPPDLDQITAVVLSGGLGTRLQAVLPHLPKPMAPVAGRPFLGWILAYLQHQQLQNVILSTGYRAEVIAAYIAEQAQHPTDFPDTLSVTCVAEPEPLGTAGGFIQALGPHPLTPLAWLVLNGDSLVVTDYTALARYLQDERVDGVILGVSVPDASRYGSLATDDQGFLTQFAEKRAGQGLINAGVYLLRPRLVAQFPAQRPLSFEYDVFPHLLAQKARLKVHGVTAPFLDIGTPDTLAQAETFIQTHFQFLLP
ncbi:nucleotidyltransferase family protein [Synechocystis sp. LKSZ1]|uniref:nucleotidyltransferase family protein n=1 Tax=Synechocystis sp. LKSZ1 TaxID=3144951 RepID=UPI00336BE797